MVYFVCEGCNETLKKNQVDKHANKCRKCQAVTCVDCNVTFWGNDFSAHTICVSEAEKYEKTIYKAPKKKLNPQEAWTSIIDEIAENCSDAPQALQFHLNRLSELGNVPRQKKKFSNFIQNSLRLYQEKIIDQLFEYISTKANAAKEASEKGIENDDKKDDKKKEKEVEIVDEDNNCDNEKEDKKKEKKEKKEKKDKKRKAEEEIVEVEIVEEEIIEKNEKKKKKKSKSDEDNNDVEEIIEEKNSKKSKKNKKEKRNEE